MSTKSNPSREPHYSKKEFFIFSARTSSAVFSKKVTDIFYKGKYRDILRQKFVTIWREGFYTMWQEASTVKWKVFSAGEELYQSCFFFYKY